ncbi:MAG: Ig-like domain-containing protein [Desulfatibacillum sp.]|nr:Ig-like domain-containing protein [Desulfatibacillum sp.]
MKKSNLRSALMLLLGIIFLFFTACGPGGSGESDTSGGGGGGDDNPPVVVTNPTVAGILYGATGNEVAGSTIFLFSNPVEADGSNGSFETEDLKKNTAHTLVALPSTLNDTYGTSYKNFTIGSADLDLSVFMPGSTFLPYAEQLATQAFSINSNTVNGDNATLNMVAQTSNSYKMLGASGLTSVNKANFRLENWDTTGPLACDLPGPDTRVAGLNANLGIQAPSVLVNVAPAMLRSLSPAGTLLLPNPDGLTNEKVLYFNPETHLWENTTYTIAQSVAGNMPITKGGLYGVFEETGGRTGTVKVWLDDINASAGDLILIGDKVYEVGTQDPITIPNVALPVNGGVLTVIIINPNTNKASESTVTIIPGSTVYSWIDPIYGDVTTVTLTSTATTLTAGGNTGPVTAENTATLTALVKDENDKALPGVTVNFETNGGALSAATAVTDADGEAQVTLSSSDTSAENVQVTAYFDDTVNPIVNATPLVFTFKPGTPSNLTLTSGTDSLYANGQASTTLQLIVLDAFDNTVADGTAVTFAVTNSSGDSILGRITADSLETADGIVNGVFTANSNPDVYTIVAKYTDAVVSNPKEITLSTPPVHSVAVASGSAQITADGASFTDITATVKDENGNAIPDGIVVTFTTSAGTLDEATAVAPPIPEKTTQDGKTVNGIARVRLFSATNLGTATVNAVAGGRGGNITITFIPGAPSKVTVTATPSSMTADGASTSAIKATVLDANDNPVADGETITFAVTQDGGSLNSLTQTTVGGIASVIYTAPASVPDGQVKVTASTTSGKSGSVIIALIGPSIASVALEVDPPSLPADGLSTATVFATVTLSGGGPAPDGTTVNFEIRSGGGTLASATGTTSGGIAQVELTAASTAGTATIRAECGGRTAEVSIEYKPGSVSVTVVQNSLLGTGKETTAIRVSLARADGTAITEGQPITFTLSNQEMGSLINPTLPDKVVTTTGPDFDEYSDCVFTGGIIGGSVEVIVKWTTSGVEVKGSVIIDIQPPPAFLQLASGYPNPASINIKGTGGQTTSQLIFNVLDSVGDLVADGYVIDFEIGDGPGGGEKVIPISAKTASGQVGTIIQSGLASGVVNVKATYHHDRTVNISASKVTITNGPPVGEGLNMSPDYLNISGSRNVGLEDVIQVTANDKYNNRIPEGSVIFFATYDTGGMLASGNASTDDQGTASDTLISTADMPIQGWVSVTAEATNGGRTTRVNSMAFSPENPHQNMYVGTNGGGVYKSTDGGASWTNMTKSSDYWGRNWLDPYVNDVAVDPDNASTVFAATGHNGQGALYRSTDGGLQWNSDNTEEVFGCLDLNAEVTKVVCDDNGSNWVWVGTQGRGFIFTNNGASPNISWYQAGLSSNVDTFSGTDGMTVKGSSTLTSASATFMTSGFQAGDTLTVNAVGGNSAYTDTVFTIASVDSENQVTLNADLGVTTREGDVTSGNGATVYNSGVFVSNDATFLTSGYQVGDTVTIVDGKDAGTYEILSVDSETQVTLDTTLSTSVGEPMEGGDGQYFKGQVKFTSASAKFVDEGFKAGDRLVITSGADIGLHTIGSVIDNTSVNLTTPLTTTYADPRTGINAASTDIGDVLSLPSEDLFELGIDIGYAVAITSGADIGTYTVTNVMSSTTVQLSGDIGDGGPLSYLLFYGSSNPQERSNGILRENASGETIFNSLTATFVTDGFKVGDILFIRSGGDTGIYDILEVRGETTLVLDTSYTDPEQTNLDYTIFHVRNNVNYSAHHKQSGYTTSTDNSYWTNRLDGSSTVGSAVITSSGANFVTDGYEVGDIVTINSGSDAGVYTVLGVSSTELTLDRELNSQCGPVYAFDDGSTVGGSNILRSDSADFDTEWILPGDTVIISSGIDAGIYSVVAVVSATQISLNATLAATDLVGETEFKIYHACESIDFTVYHAGLTNVSFLASYSDFLVSFTIISNDVSDDDAGLHVRDGKWVKDIVKVSGNGATAVVYAGTQTGVFRSEDGGQTWGYLKDTFEGSTIKSLAGATIGAKEIIYAGTEDAGLWVYEYTVGSSTGTWTNYSEGLDRALLVTTPVASVDNVGSGILSDMTVKDDSVTEFWTLTCTAAAENGGIFSLYGSVSGVQTAVNVSTGPYTDSSKVGFTLSDGVTDFEVGDFFTFSTVRDDGMSVTDVVVDLVNNKLYAATIYYEGSDVYHEVGNLMVRDIDAVTGLPTGDWRDATSGLPQFESPDNTLFAVHTIGLSNLSNDPANTDPQAIFAGGQGIHLYKATDGHTSPSGTTNLSTGEVYWQASETYLNNVIMTRNVILFSGDVGFQSYNSASNTLSWIGGAGSSSSTDWAEIVSQDTGTKTVKFTLYVQDSSGNPPVAGTLLQLKTYKIEDGEYKEIDTINIKSYGDALRSSGTWRDLTDPDTNSPFVSTITFGATIMKVEFILTQSSSCGASPLVAPGCNGANEILTYTY